MNRCDDCGGLRKHLNIIDTVDTRGAAWKLIVCDRCKKTRDKIQQMDDRGWYHQ